MKHLPLIAVAFLATSAHAADKGQPATFEQIMSLPERKAVTCYVETSVAGTFLRDDRQASAGIGGGCDAKLANLLIGGGVRADFAEWRNAGAIFAKLGVYLNNGVAAYGWAQWNVPKWKIKDAGQLMLGGGVEVKLDIINPNLSAFGETGVVASKYGSGVGKDDLQSRLGLRLKF